MSEPADNTVRYEEVPDHCTYCLCSTCIRVACIGVCDTCGLRTRNNKAPRPVYVKQCTAHVKAVKE